MPISEAQLLQLQAVNGKWNAVPYDGLPGPSEPQDWWTDIPVAGNSFVCRDYVEAKAQDLRSEGWPATALTVILCWTEPLGADDTREYHAVLGVETGGETWVLDNRIDEPYRLDLTSPSMMPPPANRYSWERRQVGGTTEFQPLA